MTTCSDAKVETTKLKFLRTGIKYLWGHSKHSSSCLLLNNVAQLKDVKNVQDNDGFPLAIYVDTKPIYRGSPLWSTSEPSRYP